MMQLIEDISGAGELIGEKLACRVHYRIRRFQSILPGSGLPVPGRHELDGSILFAEAHNLQDWTGAPLTLKLHDGRTLVVTLDSDGRISNRGHGPHACLCC